MAEVLLADGSNAHEPLCSVVHPSQYREKRITTCSSLWRADIRRFTFSEHLHRIRLAFFSQPFPTRWERLARCGRVCEIAGARNTTASGRDPIFPVIIHPAHGELPAFFYISLDINQALMFLSGSHSQPLLSVKCVVLRLQTLHSSRRHVACPPFFPPTMSPIVIHSSL